MVLPSSSDWTDLESDASSSGVDGCCTCSGAGVGGNCEFSSLLLVSSLSSSFVSLFSVLLSLLLSCDSCEMFCGGVSVFFLLRRLRVDIVMSLISRLVKTPALSCSFRVDFGVAVVTSKLTKE